MYNWPLMEQEIHFCTTGDGVRIAYSTAGEGPPLVKAANWLTHLEFDWQSPVWRHLFTALAENHQLVRYDERGTGLSDRHVEEVSLDGWVRDLEAVVDALELERFALLGISQGGPTAIQYAIRHPERVSHLVLYGTYGRWPSADSDIQASLLSAVLDGWGKNTPAFRQLFTSIFIPEATTEQMDWFNELQSRSASREVAAKILQEVWRIDVSDILPALTTKTLVIHREGDFAVVLDGGRELAALIPDARFVPIRGNNHYILEQEPEFETFLDVVEEFLGQMAGRRHTREGSPVQALPGRARATPLSRKEALTERELDVLRLIAMGKSSREISSELVLSVRTVDRHISNMYTKIGAHNRAQATAYALAHSLVLPAGD